MLRAATVVAAGALLAGAALLAYAVGTGGAHLYVLVIFPGLAGSSPAFLGGTVLLFLGVWALLISLGLRAVPSDDNGGAADAGRGPRGDPSRSTMGGMILVGPVPILFGSARPAEHRTYVLIAVVGAVVFLVSLAVFGVL